MLFLITTENRPGSVVLRKETVPAHVEYLDRFRAHFVGSGPMLSDDGRDVTGTLMILDMPSREALDAWLAEEPYCAAGLYASIQIRRWRFGSADTNRKDRDFA